MNIFNHYYRADSKNDSCLIDGTGLGLAIVSQTIQLIQGEIKAESVLGSGSKFTVIVPFKVQDN